MSNNTTAKSTQTTVRMFDGKGWDTYKRGSKAHRKAEARRAAWEATRPSKVEAQAANKYLADGMRAAELVPAGQAWKAFKAGERDVATLKALNVADGLVFRAPKAKAEAPAKASTKAAKAGKGKKAAYVAPDAPEGVVETRTGSESKAERKAAKRRAKAGRKAYVARVEAGKAVRNERGQFVKTSAPAPVVEAPVVDEAVSVRKGGKKALFWADLRDVGLTDAQITAAWAARKANA